MTLALNGEGHLEDEELDFTMPVRWWAKNTNMKMSLRGSIRMGRRGGRNLTNTTRFEERRTRNEKSVVAEESDSEYGQIAVGVWLRNMKVEPKDVDSRVSGVCGRMQ